MKFYQIVFVLYLLYGNKNAMTLSKKEESVWTKRDPSGSLKKTREVVPEIGPPLFPSTGFKFESITLREKVLKVTPVCLRYPQLAKQIATKSRMTGRRTSSVE